MRQLSVFASAMFAICALACSESGETGSDASRQSGEAHGDTISLSGRVVDYAFKPLNPTSLSGVRVCQETPPRCTESYSNGVWKLDGLSPGREILLTYEKSGYLSVVQAIVTPRFTSHVGIVGLVSLTLEVPGLPLPEVGHRSSVSFNVDMNAGDPNTLPPAVHVHQEPDPGSDPLYVVWRSAKIVTEIPKDGAGYGLYRDVPAGDDYALVYELDGGHCTRQDNGVGGWPDRDGRPNVTRVVARTDFTTYLTTQLCELDSAR